MEKLKKILIENKCDVLFCLFVIATTVFLFRGVFEYGMEFDEVYRINNMFQYFNPDAYPCVQYISSLKIGTITIPLMLKPYISYLVFLPYLAVAWTGYPFITLRCLYGIYLVVGILVLYFWMKKYNKNMALMAGLLLLFCPFLYPEVKYGWSSVLYIVPIALFSMFIKKYIDLNESKWLFFAFFSLFFFLEIQFYFAWIVVAIVLTIVFLYPRRVIVCLKKGKNVFAILVAVCLAMINYIIYNIQNGFPTLRTLWVYLFDLDSYNKTAIDNKTTSSFFDGLLIKLRSYVACVGDPNDIWVKMIIIIVGVMLLLYLLLAIYMIVQKTIMNNKVYFMPIMVFVFAFLFMIISPNSQGAHHFTYMIVPICISLAMLFHLFISEFSIGKKVWKVLYCILLCGFIVQSNANVVAANEDMGSGCFTNQIFSLLNYIESKENISDNNLFFVEWGFSQQFYFMNQGEFDIREYTFQISSDDSKREAFYDWLFFEQMDPELEYYFPIYASDVSNGGTVASNGNHILEDIEISDVAESIISYAENNGWTCIIDTEFYEEDGSLAIALIKLQYDKLADMPR